ncbi:hypothetical protein LTS10_001229 [Elasticomyces elasticus]|nr:hypothetical protein LTS10_001229 [Elasticomyces elasticus]
MTTHSSTAVSESDISNKPASMANLDVESGEKVSSAPNPEAPSPELARWKWTLTLVGLCLGSLLYGLDTTIAADVQAPIYEQFGEIENLTWVGIGFPMASVAVILLLGRLFDLFDVKIINIVSVALFEGGSALCGGAPNMSALIVGRVIAGIGGAGMYLAALTYVSVFAEPSKVSFYNALMGFSWGVGAILGPVIGGAFAVSSASWRWAFYINLPLAGLLAPAWLFVFPSHNPAPSLNVFTKLRTLDWVGALLNAATYTLFIVALTFSGARFAWSSSTVIAIWAVWAACLLAFVLQQTFSIFTSPERRIFPVHLLRHKDFILLYIATSCSAVANGVAIYYMPLFFAFTHGDRPLQAAVRLLRYIIVFITFVLIAGGTLPVIGRWSIYFVVGSVFTLAGSAAMFTICADTSPAKVYAYEALIAIGSGMTFQIAYAVMAAKVTRKDQANAIGFINVAQLGTTALALAIASCLFQNLGFNFLKDALTDYDLDDSFLRAALGGAASAQLQSAPPEVVRITVETVAYTIARVFGTCIAVGALLAVSSVFMTWEKLDLTGQEQEKAV